MRMSCLHILVLLLSIFGEIVLCVDQYSRNDFPTGFIFGSGSSAYQVEGAVSEDGRTPSIWDTFAHAGYAGGANGDVACDAYHKYKEDIQLMVETGLEAYRFSISWSRLIPNGRGRVNQKAVTYYNNVIDELILHGIEPHVTLVHSDLPQVLEDEYEGWLSRMVVKDFLEYAKVCFELFGDRVLHWTTLNEPNVYAIGGYGTGLGPPMRCSPSFKKGCVKGNSSSEPYLAGHHLLLAHSSAARLYKSYYQVKQGGVVGINLCTFGLIPDTNATEDVIATKRAYDFYIGWFADPLVYGKYPEIMKRNVGKRMPTLSEEESKQMKGSFDFIALNHYSNFNIKNKPSNMDIATRDLVEDMEIEQIFKQGNTPPDELPIEPFGLQGVLEYFKQVHGNPPLYIHENGQRTWRWSTLNDTSRVKYLHAYIGTVLDAVRHGSNTKGYFTWSFLDLFELLDGSQLTYGLYFVDSNDKDLKRYPKDSAYWYSSFLKGEKVGLVNAITSSQNIRSHFSQ